MTARGHGWSVSIVRVGEDSAPSQQPPEAAFAEQIFKAREVVVAKLIYDNSKNKANLLSPVLVSGTLLAVNESFGGTAAQSEAKSKGNPALPIRPGPVRLNATRHCSCDTLLTTLKSSRSLTPVLTNPSRFSGLRNSCQACHDNRQFL